MTPDDFRVSGRLVRYARLKNEWYDEIEDVHQSVTSLKTAKAKFDVLSIIQRPGESPRTLPQEYKATRETDHVAGIPLTTFENWWENQVIKKIRKNVRRSEKDGIVVKTVPFDDALIHGIMEIYQEVPMRSGRPFRHFNDDFETCKRKHETFLDRSTFIGAFLEGKLIGFIKMVRAGCTARTMQFISMDKFRALSPANALLAHAVKECTKEGLTYLVYGKLNYGKRGNAGLEEFKRANGFERLEFPRYYIPISCRGKLGITLKLHREWLDLLPKPCIAAGRDLRARWHSWKLGTAGGMDSDSAQTASETPNTVASR